jgi:hypothetical protein
MTVAGAVLEKVNRLDEVLAHADARVVAHTQRVDALNAAGFSAGSGKFEP